MKQINLLIFLTAFFISPAQVTQPQIPNGGFESWSGINPVTPDGWVTTEQLQNLKVNKWVNQETRQGYVRVGSSAIRLSADTVQGKTQVNNEAYGVYSLMSVMHTDGKTGALTTGQEEYSYMTGVISAGRLTTARGYSVASGVAVNGRPVTMSFYVRTNHPIPDTASYRLLLTRWNPSRGTQDTVSYEREDIFPDSTVMSGYVLFTDTIDYKLLGDADTARITIFGGRRRNVAARGNSTWIDGLAFGYSLPAAQRGSAMADSLWLTPNPVGNTMMIKSDPSMQGYKIVIQAESGEMVKEVIISQTAMTVDMTDIEVGNYTYAVLDRDERKIRNGYISVLRN